MIRWILSVHLRINAPSIMSYTKQRPTHQFYQVPFFYFWVSFSGISLYRLPKNSNKLQWLSKQIEQYVTAAAAAAAKSLQSCPTLCNPIDVSLPGSAIPGILQARTLEWVAISFSKAWKWKVKVKSLSRVRLSATPWTAAYQAPPSMGQCYFPNFYCSLP